MRILKNSEITVEMLPRIDDPEAIFDFAMTFNGFDHYGSFDACAEAARARTRSNLTELRNELFLEARASRHRMDDQYVDWYREIYPDIKAMLRDG